MKDPGFLTCDGRKPCVNYWDRPGHSVPTCSPRKLVAVLLAYQDCDDIASGNGFSGAFFVLADLSPGVIHKATSIADLGQRWLSCAADARIWETQIVRVFPHIFARSGRLRQSLLDQSNKTKLIAVDKLGIASECTFDVWFFCLARFVAGATVRIPQVTHR